MQQPTANRRQEYPFDEVDLGLMLMTAIVPPHWPWAVLLGVQTIARRSPNAVRRILDTLGWEADAEAAQWLLPGASKLLDAPKKTTTAQGPATDAGPSLGTLEALSVLSAPETTSHAEVSMARVLERLPRRVDLLRLKLPASTTAIPLGVDHEQQPIWVDLATDTYHIGLYGQTGAGKDNLLRCWFTLLTRRNSPDTIQFAFLDGKGDWLLPQLASLGHMFIAPAGGYGRKGDEAIMAAVKAIDAEAERRQSIIREAGCISRDQYVRKASQAAMPLLCVIATDVMTSVAGDVEELLVNQVSKARSLGIRVIVSMQTPTGRDTRWRGNLSTVLAGNLQLASQDEPAMGLPARSLRFRPSELPPSQQRPGVFVGRVGGEQVLVQAPYLAEDDFERQVVALPRKVSTPKAEVSDDLLDFLLTEVERYQPADRELGESNEGNEGVTASGCDVTESIGVTVTAEEAARIASLLATLPPSEVTKRLPGYTPRRYAEFKAKVEKVRRMLG